MHIRVVHETRYRFNRPVFLEPHLLRLLPRSDAGQKVESFSVSMDPAPKGQWEIIDASGSPAQWVWFEGMTAELRIVTRSVTNTLRANPFGFLLQPEGLSLPPRFTPGEEAALAPCLRPSEDDAIRELAHDLAREAGGESLGFLTKLNDWLFRHVEIAPRQKPGIQPAAETLRRGTGACRDVTAVFMAVSRQAGIPCRYVSGYHFGEEESAHELHAWAEAYLPGAGWHGYDPTAGLCVAEGHVALCSAHSPDLTAPVTGSFRGNASSTLEHRVRVDVAE